MRSKLGCFETLCSPFVEEVFLIPLQGNFLQDIFSCNENFKVENTTPHS